MELLQLSLLVQVRHRDELLDNPPRLDPVTTQHGCQLPFTEFTNVEGMNCERNVTVGETLNRLSFLIEPEQLFSLPNLKPGLLKVL